jgi:hypothetical protein
MAVGRQPRTGGHDDRVLRYTRGLAVFITPFLLVAFVILYLLPSRTATLWAWPIAASMTSMTLASAYLGGAYFFVLVVRSRHWHEVSMGFPAVTTFASLLGVATLLHWDKFLHSHLAFWLWAGLYFTAPFLVAGAWIVNRRYAVPPGPEDVLLRPRERAVVVGLALVSLATGVTMFVAPAALSGSWPWLLTPLTCRVMAATFCLGGACVGVWFDPRWSAVRLMLQVEAVMLALMLLAAVRARHELIGSRPLAWPLLVGVLATLVGSAYLWRTYEPGPRRHPQPA